MIILKDSEELKLSNIEIIILRFVETRTAKFINMTITELADALYVSIGAITHFVKKVGFTNYKDFKKHVIEVAKMEKKSDIYDPNEDIENVNLFYVHSVEKTVNLMDIKMIERVSTKIVRAKKIITFGLGSSLMPAKEMANALNSLTLDAIVASSTHDIISWVDETMKNDYLIVIFSKTMTSNELTFLYKLLLKHEIPTVLITSNRHFVTQHNLDVLLFETLEQDRRLFSLSSKISELFISDILLMKAHSKLKKEKGPLYQEFQRVWRKRRINV